MFPSCYSAQAAVTRENTCGLVQRCTSYIPEDLGGYFGAEERSGGGGRLFCTASPQPDHQRVTGARHTVLVVVTSTLGRLQPLSKELRCFFCPFCSSPRAPPAPCGCFSPVFPLGTTFPRVPTLKGLYRAALSRL